MTDTTFILASTSKTRQSILRNAGMLFEPLPPACNEEELKHKYAGPSKFLAEHLATAKALSLSRNHPKSIVIGADQTLLFNDEVISKPRNLSDARDALQKLRGETHVLLSAVALARGQEIIWQTTDTATLTMRDFSDHFLDHYLAQIGGKAFWSPGSYQIEDTGIQLFEAIEGDFFSILGLPLLPLLSFLREKGMLPR